MPGRHVHAPRGRAGPTSRGRTRRDQSAYGLGGMVLVTGVETARHLVDLAPGDGRPSVAGERSTAG
jgi:hypothetical protein